MKKLWLLAFCGICACATTVSISDTSNVVDLDTAIQASSKEINDSLTPGTKVALLNFNSSSDVLSDYVLEEMSISLVRDRKLIVVDRKEIDLIRGEMNFQMSGDVSDESAQQIGMMLGAQSIISGSLVSMGDTYRFRTKVINVNSAAIQTSSSISVKDDLQIQYMLSQGKASSSAAQSNAIAVPAQAASSELGSAAPTSPTLRTYNIGETGPAGGLIFYDKGNNSGGWRYLEAAPEEAEFQARWSESSFWVGDDVNFLRVEIGYGRRNTEIIVNKFREVTGNWNTAAQKCYDLVFNGFNDWFFPSQSELDQMFGNLKRRNLGDLKNEKYWCSYQYNYYGWGDRNAVYQDFNNGQVAYTQKNIALYVRPIRQVPGPEGTRSSNGGSVGTVGRPGRNVSSILYTLLGVLILGGVLAFVIWGPTPSGATT